MLLTLLMLAWDPDALVARMRELTAIERCPVDRDDTTVTVCGRRNADRYRVPLLVQREPGASTLDNAALERTALLHRTNPIEELSPFLVGGGHVGVTVGTSFGPGAGSGKTTISGERPLAP